jgi:Plasmid stabilisation system protein.
MLALKLSPLAKNDLFNIWDYIAEDSEVNADRFLAKDLG